MRFVKALKNISRFIAAILGIAFGMLALAVPLHVLTICYEGGCIDRRQKHWLRNLAALGLIALALCLSSFIIAAMLFFYARHGAFRTAESRPSSTVR